MADRASVTSTVSEPSLASTGTRASEGHGRRRTWALRRDPAFLTGLVLFVLIALVAAFAPLLAPHEPIRHSSARLSSPTAVHPLGTDAFGRDILSRIIHGSRLSLVTSLGAIVAAAVIGSAIGILAALFGGAFDRSTARLADGILAFPSVLIGTLVLVLFGPGTWNLLLALAIAFLPRFYRLARGAALEVVSSPFVEAARGLGAGWSAIAWRHLLPSVQGDLLTMAGVWAATAIRIEATLSFLGLGAQPPAPSWGLMLREGMDAILFAPGLAVYPGIAIVLTVLSLNLMSDGARDRLDP